MTNPSTIATSAVENEQPAQGWQAPQAEADTVAPTLRAMATNYPDGHLWDKLDARACIRGAREIERLRAAQAPQINAEDGNVWPIVNIDVDAAGNVTAAKLYAPGLPAGNHDVYPVRVPYMDEHTEAWLTVVKALREVASTYLDEAAGNGIERAVTAIRRLAGQAPVAPAAPAPKGDLTEDDKQAVWSRTAIPDYKARFETMVYMIGEISQALGISDDDAACANGNDLILAAIRRLAAQAPSTPPTAPTDEPRLNAPAQVGNVRFSKGIRHSLVIQVAQRHHAYMNTSERETARIASAMAFAAALRPGGSALAADQPSEDKRDAWVPVADRLPDAGRTVLAFYLNRLGKPRRIRAVYIGEKTREHNTDCDEGEAAYDEATDTYYWVAGWYEQIDNWDEYSCIAVTEGEITHWVEIPVGPAIDTALRGSTEEPA